RLVLVGVGAAALIGRAVTVKRDPARPHWLVMVIAPIYAGLVAGWALFSGGPADVSRASFLAGTVLTVSAIDVWLVGLAARPVVAGRRWLEERLGGPGRRLVAQARELSSEIRPGEQIVVTAGETVPADLEIL